MIERYFNLSFIFIVIIFPPFLSLFIDEILKHAEKLRKNVIIVSLDTKVLAIMILKNTMKNSEKIS